MTASQLRRRINWYAPLVGAGVRVVDISDDFRRVRVEMPLRWYNRNYVGTHYGGSLYSMVDPFFMLMAIRVLGPEYVVWDKSAAIEFVAPGRGTVSAECRLTDADVATMRSATARGEKYLPTFTIDITDAAGTLVARVQKQLYVRRKPSDAA